MFETFDYYKNNDIEILINKYDKNKLINEIKKSEDKIAIIDLILQEILDKYPEFCFELIYALKDFEYQTIYLLEKYNLDNMIDQNKLFNILNSTNWGIEYVIKNFEKFDENKLKIVFFYGISSKNQKLLNTFKNNKNLHIRYLFMTYLINYNFKLFRELFPNILNYLKNSDEVMNSNDLCTLAIAIKKYSLIDFENIREFIFNNYSKNSMAKLLLDNDKEELEKDINMYFGKTNTMFYTLYNNYKKKLDITLINELETLLKIYGTESFEKKILDSEFMPKLYDWTEKYLDLSKDKRTEFLGSGSTAKCYRVGDFIFKLVKFKWSYEDVICPNLYLILKNEEEIFKRDQNNMVVLGIEVQKYLKTPANNISLDILKLWENELEKNGYILNDTLINGSRGTNAFLLDSYLDADTKDFSIIPEWFKKTPVVLVDRDRVYKKNKRFKQFNGRY